MKFVSPDQRGTTCWWRCAAIEPPATAPRFQPTLKRIGPIDGAQRGERVDRAAVQLGRLVGREVGQSSRDVTYRSDHQVPGRVRELVEEHEDAGSPRCTTSESSPSASSASRQKTQPSCSPAWTTYSSLQGAHSCRVTPASSSLAAVLMGLVADPVAHGGEVERLVRDERRRSRPRGPPARRAQARGWRAGQGEQDDGADQALARQPADHAEAERDLAEEEERSSRRAGRRRARGRARSPTWASVFFSPSAHEHDARDEHEVDVRVGVPGELVLLLAHRSRREPALRGDRGDVEVEPPERPLRRRSRARRASTTPGPMSVPAPTPIATIDSPSAMITIRPCRSAKWRGASRQPSEPKRKGPAKSSTIASSQSRPWATPSTNVAREQDADGDRAADAQPCDRPSEVGIVAVGDPEERDLAGADDRVGADEEQGLRVERLRHGERRHEQPGHRAEHHEPDDPLLGIDDARQPRVADPGPPEHGEHEQPTRDAGQRRPSSPSAPCTG